MSTAHELVFRKPGDDIVLQVAFYDNGVLFNPYEVRQLVVQGPTETPPVVLTPVRVVDGKWAATYPIPTDAAPGLWTYTVYWTALEGMTEKVQDYYFSVELPTAAAALNKEALDKTISYYDAEHDDIIWMVCTGQATTPSLQVIFNLVTKSFRTKTMIASAMAMDNINDDYPNQELILAGDASGHIFYMGLADDDLGENISCTMETDDKRPDPANVGQVYEFQEAKLTVRANGAGQLLHMDWFVDGSAVEASPGGVDFTLSTDSISYRTPLTGAGEKLRVRINNADVNGPITLTMWDFMFVPIRGPIPPMSARRA